jgi:hypothetical protein
LCYINLVTNLGEKCAAGWSSGHFLAGQELLCWVEGCLVDHDEANSSAILPSLVSKYRLCKFREDIEQRVVDVFVDYNDVGHEECAQYVLGHGIQVLRPYKDGFMSGNTEDAQGVDVHFKSKLSLALGLRGALIAEVDFWGAIKTFHETSLLLRNLADRAHWDLALCAINRLVVGLGANELVGQHVFIVAKAGGAAFIVNSENNVQVEELRRVLIVGASLQESGVLFVFFDVEEELGVLACGPVRMRGGN